MFLSVTNIQLKQGPRNFSKKTKIEFYFILKLKSGLWNGARSKQAQRFLSDPDMRKEPNAERFFKRSDRERTTKKMSLKSLN